MNIFLFAHFSFLEGIARVLDISGALTNYNNSPNAEIADYLAIKSDWSVVSEDCWYAIQKFESQHEQAIQE